MHVAPIHRVQRRPVHGVLLLDKPLGLSSNQALQKVKWLLRAEKAGHTGTLDPLATGVLPLCFGAATKFSQQHLDADKGYTASLALGVATATGDLEGAVIERKPVPPMDDALLAQLAKVLRGQQLQLPPMYSALKKDGKALYEYARAGQEVERAPRQIHVHELNLRFGEGNDAKQLLDLEVVCSKGTYIRTLGEDVAKALGTVGHLTALRRTRTGVFDQACCVRLQDLEAMDETQRLSLLLPTETLLHEHIPVLLTEPEAVRFLSGLRRRVPQPDTPHVAVYGPAVQAGGKPHLLGTAHIRAGELIPDRLLNPDEIRQIAQQSAA